MQLILLAYVALYDSAVALVEIRQNLEQFLIGLINAANEVRQLVFLEVLAECPETVLHELVDLYGVVVLVLAVDGEANGADESPVLAVGVDADEGGVLPMGVTVVGLDEIFEALGELLYVSLYRHHNKISIISFT